METNPNQDPALLQGITLADRYLLEEYLGSGRFGAVYRATQIAFGVSIREVAVKISASEVSSDEANRIFSKMLSAAKALENNPNASLRERFISIYDAGICHGHEFLADHAYLAMEYVQSGSLRRALEEGPFDIKRAMGYFDQILSCVAYLHGGLPRTLAHRALKPTNILISHRVDGTELLKLTDYGLIIAHPKPSDPHELAYLAPENLSNEAYSTQSDIYTLGLIFYEMVSGSNPFLDNSPLINNQGDSFRRDHLIARQSEKFLFLGQNSEIQQYPAIAQVIRNVLDPNPSRRKYRSAVDMKVAWEYARNNIATRTTGNNTISEGIIPAWERVRQLAEEAGKCQSNGDLERSKSLLQLAMTLNRDKSRVPDAMVSGSVYLAMVKQLLSSGNTREAGLLANEGYNRRRCRTTCEALAEYYHAIGSQQGFGYEKESRTVRDRE